MLNIQLMTGVVNTCEDACVTAVEPARRRWRGIEPDKRQDARRQRFLDAALELTGTGGVSAVSVRSACTTAGLTSRYFYESFTDLDALLVALYDDLATEVVDLASSAVLDRPGDLRDRLQAGLRAGADFFRQDPRRLRFLLQDAPASPALDQRRRQLTSDVAAGWQGIAHDLLGIPAAQSAFVAASIRFLIGGLIELLTTTLDDQLDTAFDDLINNATDIILTLVETAAKRR